MTHPTHPWTPCPPNNPHCNGTTEPPNPGNVGSPTVSIDNYIFLLVLVAVTLIYTIRKRD